MMYFCTSKEEGCALGVDKSRSDNVTAMHAKCGTKTLDLGVIN